MSLRKAVSFVLAIAVLLGCSGCWDRVEIDERAFVLVLAIDKFDYNEVVEQKQDKENEGSQGQEDGGGGQGEDKEEAGPQDPVESQQNRLVVSIVFPNVGHLRPVGSLIAEGLKFSLSTVGPNVFEATRQFNTRLGRNIFFGHLKAVLIGEELLSDPMLFREVMDQLERDHEIGRDVEFCIVKGKAKDALLIKPETEPIIGTYIEQIFLQRRTGRFHGKNLGQIVTGLRETRGALTPRLVVGEEEFKVAGSCIIKDYRYVGWLGEVETRAAQWMDEMAGEDVISVDIHGLSIPFEITHLKRKMQIHRDERDNIYLAISLTIEGNIAGHVLGVHEGAMDEEFVREVEETISREMEAQCTAVMDKLQNQFGVDIWDIGDRIRKFHPEIWDDIKDNWEEVFPELRVSIAAHVNVRRIGITK